MSDLIFGLISMVCNASSTLIYKQKTRYRISVLPKEFALGVTSNLKLFFGNKPKKAAFIYILATVTIIDI